MRRPIDRVPDARPAFSLESLARERGLAHIARLGSNENCLGPSPLAVRAARRAVRTAHRYPDAEGARLRQALSRQSGLPPDAIVLGNGSSELIELLARTYLGRSGNAIIPEGSFVAYRLAVAAHGGVCREAPMTPALGANLEAVLDAIDARTRLVFLANPNNPTGTYVTRRELRRFLGRVPERVVVAVDEAYREYVVAGDYPDAARLLGSGPRLLVLRTFSKIHGLAGLRIGYALADPEIARDIERARAPYSVSIVAQEAALAALGDRRHAGRSQRHNLRELRFLARGLERIGVASTPSVANFLLVHPPTDPESLARRLLLDGVLVRPMGSFGFPRAFRVTVGTRPENLRFLRAMRALGSNRA